MSEIRPLTPEDIDAQTHVYANAYPRAVTRTAEGLARARERAQERLSGPGQGFGLFREGQLHGIMKLYDFTMNFAGHFLPVGGVGGVAVHFLHKKEHVAKEMIHFYLDHYRQKGTYLAALYPFRPDFYRRMGFGFGTRMHQFQVRPAGFPRGRGKEHLQFLSTLDLDRIHACYERFYQRRHGLFARTPADSDRAWRRPDQQMIGFVDGSQVRGYLRYSFKGNAENNFLDNNLIVHELVYDDAAVLAEFLTFLHSQLDQINRVVFNTQDADFWHLLHDPRNHRDHLFPLIAHETNIQGTGLMYRVIDLPGLLSQLADYDFGGVTLSLALTLQDSFRPENDGRHLIRFQAGRATLIPEGKADVELRLDVAAFASLLLGAVALPALLRLGLATLNQPAHAAAVAQLFYRPEAPICLTPF